MDQCMLGYTCRVATFDPVTGTCGAVDPNPPADCDGVAANGCEVDLRTSATACGACGTSCGTGRCEDSRCDKGEQQESLAAVVRPLCMQCQAW